MRIAMWLVAAIVCTALTACATERPTLANVPCNEGTCFLDVTVSDCKIVVDPEEIQIAKGNRGPVIHWKLDTSSFMNYRFADRGITFGDAGKDQFDTPQGSAFGKEFTWTDRNTVAGKYKYTVNIVRRWSGEACVGYDPWVINN